MVDERDEEDGLMDWMDHVGISKIDNCVSVLIRVRALCESIKYDSGGVHLNPGD